MGIVRLGFFDDFKSNDTLLLEGDQEGLNQLLEAIASLAAKKVNSVEIDRLPSVKSHRGVKLLALVSGQEQGIVKTSTSFQWICSPGGWEGIAEKVVALSENGAGHQYFGTPQDKVIVMVSLGEYGAAWWEKHG